MTARPMCCTRIPGSTNFYLLASTGTSFSFMGAFAGGVGQPAWELAGDVNGDGKTDLIYQDPNSTSIRVLTSGGTRLATSNAWITGMSMSAWRVA